ncbi:DEAD/DEAH box helicase [Azospirillum agricola]|uniref:DEAD/DEAH box helicase n=1 Tax=Azospirillum agricola TaxID=1720247 RepID=UPI000A0EFDC3|nr:DEAD/DEAH box helicase [Azospirillum agricola]SMH45799.1 transcription-repair coupling factor (superfamily II helicase) [Azospirillum lipoferum]
MFDGTPSATHTPPSSRSPAEPPGDTLTVLSEGELAVRLMERARRPGGVLFLARSDSRAARLAWAVGDLAPDLDVLLLPVDEATAGDRVPPSRAVLGRRMAGLAALAQPSGPGGRLILASAELALQRLPPAGSWTNGILRIERGAPVDEEAWRAFFARAGYVLDDRVDEPGEVAIRGAVVEVFPGDGDRPVRCEIADGIVAELRLYDPVSQRSTGTVDAVTLHPVSEIVTDAATLDRLGAALAGRGATLPEDMRAAIEAGRRPYAFDRLLPVIFDDCPLLLDCAPDAAIVLDAGARDRIEARAEDLREVHIDRRLRRTTPSPLPAPPPEHRLIDAAAFEALLAGRRVATVDLVVAERPEEQPRSERTLLRRASALIAEGARVLIAAGDGAEADRLAAAAARTLGIEARRPDRWPGDGLPAGGCAVMPLRVADGFVCDSVTVLVPPRRAAGTARDAPIRTPLAPAELSTGDFVVHLDYGIGRLVGLETIGQTDKRGDGTGDAQAGDFLVLDYARDDRLLVPAADLDRLWRHGSSDSGARLDTLKNGSWLERRAVLEREIADTAKALLVAARRRSREKAPVIAPPADRMRRFAARFGFDPTEGQARAAADVIGSMARGWPMDHLVCADVGYGKTEVALRAAAAVVFSGFQVAVMAPTSVLARQHLDTFRRRFAGFGVTIEPLTGAMDGAETARVRAGMADGSVAIVVGTHALLSREARFQRLGLMVVDEEQRFGADQKEALRRRTRGVHSLALSATPIPRTLQGALAGTRGLSVIDTPPARRRPVRTTVIPRDPEIARAALLREHARGGQSFCVVPRVADLKPLEAWLRALVPGLRIAVAHGRLGPQALDDAVMGFVDGESDVLLATPIIESGIDIPRANTLLLFRPDLFGLGQLHQLRGRVGRGAVQGYAWLMTDPDHPLEERAARRLASLELIESLGGGFALSLLDLDQRGGGDPLGTDQTGHRRAVGTELYQRILADALRALRREPDEGWTPEVTVAVPQTIPAAYIPEPELRIGLHRRIARMRDAADVDALREEMEDRFGTLPETVEGLLDVATLRCRCRRLGIAALKVGPAGVALTLRGDSAAKRCTQLAKRSDGLFLARGDRVTAALASEDPAASLTNAARCLDAVESTRGEAAGR